MANSTKVSKSELILGSKQIRRNAFARLRGESPDVANIGTGTNEVSIESYKPEFRDLVPPSETERIRNEKVMHFLGDGRKAFRGDESFGRALHSKEQFAKWIFNNASPLTFWLMLVRTEGTMRNMLHRMQFSNAQVWISAEAEKLRHIFDVADDLRNMNFAQKFWSALFDPRRRRELDLSKVGGDSTELANIDES